MRCFLAVLVVLFASAARAQEADTPPSARRPGQISQAEKAVFTERSKLSAMVRVAIRMGGSAKAIPEGTPDYDLSKETFQVYVPPGYDGKQPHGLFVWISGDESGLLPPEWLTVLAEHKLIAVGADRSGNDRPTWIRLGLALDAVHNLSKKYPVDPHRVFVAGGNVGGRVASELAIAWPDVFEGGYYMVGCSFYRVMTNAKGRPWAAGFAKPPPKYFELAQRHSRHVLLTGDGDVNREQTSVYYKGMREDGFLHVAYIEIPNFGHQLPDRQWFEKGLVLMDPLPEAEASAKVGASNPEADKLLSAAKLYASNHQYPGARTRLQKLIDTYPNTTAAKEAKDLMKEIEGK
jgi:hypothetical protein